MTEYEQTDQRYEECGKALVEFLLNHRGVLEDSSTDPVVKNLLTQAHKEPRLAFYCIAQLFTLYADMARNYHDLRQSLAQQASINIDFVNDKQLLQKFMEKQRKKKRGSE